MKHLSLLVPLCALLLSAGACDKSKSGEHESETVTPVAKVVGATKTTAMAPKPDVVVAEKAAAQPAGEPACAGGGDHSGMECMNNVAEGEGGGCNAWDDAADEISKRELPGDAQWKVLEVSGMTCGGCERRIIANVGKLDGVVGVEADSELGKVRVAVSKGNTTAQEAAKAKITELGYKIL